MNATPLTNSATLLRNAIIPILLVLQAILVPTPVKANDYLQCVPFARELSGIKIVDSRNILISHANWSPIDGRRGQIERRVAARDVSANNDWSLVRIWYAPIDKLGTTAFPVNGFIYPKNPAKQNGRQWASAKPAPRSQAPNRTLFDRRLKAELSQSAEAERPDNVGQVDLIGELLDRVGS